MVIPQMHDRDIEHQVHLFTYQCELNISQHRHINQNIPAIEMLNIMPGAINADAIDDIVHGLNTSIHSSLRRHKAGKVW
jgi:hypothetical protein